MSSETQVATPLTDLTVARSTQTAGLGERLSLSFGLMLFFTFAGFILPQSTSADSGLQASNQQAQTSRLAEPDAQRVPLETETIARVQTTAIPPTAAKDALHYEPASFELWDRSRIREHKESLLQDTEPPLGVLRIDRLDIEVPVFNGTDEFVLNRGVGRIEGTARINGAGNLGIAGHRDGFFRGLKDIQKGDVLHLQTIHGEIQYRVNSMIIVDPENVSVLAPTTEQTLTLVTCYPFYFAGNAPKRFIVKAVAEPPIAMN